MSSNGNGHGGQISMMEALSRIESRGLKERAGGLTDLRHILQHNRDNPDLGNFDDKSFHKIFEVLFVVASDERSHYLKSLASNSASVRTGAATRFTNCSQTLRLAVERGARNIRLRTLKALLDHLTETLLDAHGACCEPIALDYSRCLSAVLAYEPHVEHLKDAQWQQIAGFCIDRVNAAGSSSTKTTERLPRQALDEFVHCVRYLTNPASAPILNKSEAIIESMLQYLGASQSVGQAQISALSTISNVILQIRVEKHELTLSIVRPCLQAARQLWSSRLVAVKNELLIMLVLLSSYIRALRKDANDIAFIADLEGLSDQIASEYSRRDPKDQLRMDDLRLSCTAEPTCQELVYSIFGLKDGMNASLSTSPDGEHNWTLLRLLAQFRNPAINATASDKTSILPMGGDKKRMRRTGSWDDTLSMLHDTQVSVKVSSLQLICFTAQTTALGYGTLEYVLEKLSALMSDENSLISSWALLTLASCATQTESGNKELSRYWTSAWLVASRLANSTSTCRASCHLLHVLMTRGLVEDAQVLQTCASTISTIEVNGPCVVSDSALSFLLAAYASLQGERRQLSRDVPERLLTWTFRTWAPSSFRDRMSTSLNASADPLDILNLVNVCLGRKEIQRPRQILPIWGSVAQAWIVHDKSSRLVDYLLLHKDVAPFLTDVSTSAVAMQISDTGFDSNLESLLLSLAASEVNRTVEQLEHAKDQRSISMNADMVRVVGALTIVATYIGDCYSPRDVHRAAQLRANTQKLMNTFFADLSSPSCEQQNVDVFLDLISHCMGLSEDTADANAYEWRGFIPNLTQRVAELLQARGQGARHNSRIMDDESDDGMDIDIPFRTNDVASRSNHDAAVYPRRLMQTSCHSTTRKMGILVYSMLVQDVHSSADGSDKHTDVLDQLTHLLTSLNDSELIASRPMVAALLDEIGHFSPSTVGELLNRILDGPLRSYEHERSETTHALLLDTMTREIASWTNPSNIDLYQDGIDLYVWLTETALGAQMLSADIQKTLSDLLLKLLEIDMDYGQNDDLASVRTTLFGLLQRSKLEVRHHLATRVASIFSMYTLSLHDEVFDDLSDSLPADVEWMEGIAIRLLALAHIAASWPSLLRRCIYGIFETAGQVVASSSYATRCVAYISETLDLTGSQDLFRLLAPQLLFTWLDLSRSLEQIPFQIFEYSTLKQLLQENVDEVYSQLVVRENVEEIAWLSKYLNMTDDRLVRAAFPKAVAYTVSWDIVFGKDRQNRCENHLQNLMKNKGEYRSLVRTNFPYIVAQLFISVDQEETVEKALEKRPKYQYVNDALTAMKSYSASNQVLPSTQQPHFKAKYLVDQVERTAVRSSSQQNFESFVHEFTSPRLTVMLRSIIDTMHPALGPLHTCHIVRKLRLLVAFAGDGALQGYPLELLIRTLRPLAVESHCADDAIGILYYLFDRGFSYLKSSPPSLTSAALLSLLSMKSFMISREDLTTQETQHRSTVSNMQVFHDWLVTTLLKCQDMFQASDDISRGLTFKVLVTACRDLSFPASAEKSNPSSRMLQSLLDDESSTTPLLSRLERRQILSLICRRFESAGLCSEDVFASDAQSEKYARCIWSTTRSLPEMDTYENWAARILGRAFAVSITPELIRPTGRPLPDFLPTAAPTTEANRSTIALVGKLHDLLLSDHRAEVAVSEQVIRKTIARFADTNDQLGALEFENLLPVQVCEAMAECYGSDQTSSGLGRSSLVFKAQRDQLVRLASVDNKVAFEPWIRGVVAGICKWASGIPLVGSLGALFQVAGDTAQQLFPFLLHLVLLAEKQKDQVIRDVMSASFTQHFNETHPIATRKKRLMLETVVYLLTQQMPTETSRLDRLQWLDLDYLLAAEAAHSCNMPTTALYFIELSTTNHTNISGKRTRRSSIDIPASILPSNELLLDIYKSIDEPDSFYGVQQVPSLEAVTNRVDHEKDGLKGVMLYSARMDASLLRTGQRQERDARGMIEAIGAMNLDSLTHSLLLQRKDQNAATTDAMLHSARKLQQWDITPSSEAASSDSAMLYNVCKELASTSNLNAFKISLDSSLRSVQRRLQDTDLDALSTRSALSSLAVLSEIDELTTVRSATDLHDLWDVMQSRQQKWDIGRFHDAQHLMSHRETLFSIVSRNTDLRQSLNLTIRDSRTIEVKAVVEQSRFARKNGLIQQSLSAATYLSELVPACAEVGVHIDAVAQFEAASILWEQHDISSSVQMLQALKDRSDLADQAVKIGSAGLLAQLGHEVAAARLEQPEDIISQYLRPAIAQLGATTLGSEAGRVFHEFASFCDQQLQNPGHVEDFQRLERLRNRRKTDLDQFDELVNATQSSQRDKKKNLQHQRAKAKQWYVLDDLEYQKARNSRDGFVRQSLENYLRALRACNDFDASVVRFLALWLEFSDARAANEAVHQVISHVPSWKFVGLTNQISSRLLEDGSLFQKILKNLVARMSVDHPYHLIHNIYAGAQSAVSHGDKTAEMRRSSAIKIKDYVRGHKTVGALTTRIWQSCHEYVRLAQTKVTDAQKSQKLTLQNFRPVGDIVKAVLKCSVPPATLRLELRPNADYRNVPVIARFRSEIKVAGGLSAPKVLTAVGTDGQEYKQLFKGGNDDLRQDAIMEQVFAEVSKMLQNHKATRQRSINIRTYKVLPLTAQTGIIEFVPNSIPLADFLIPAHNRYHPEDLKTDSIRKKISEAAQHSKETRYKVYKEMTSRFQPVLRHFFFERFDDPDDWFMRRLAYTRSTAAISILGWVLGLGDRHTQNVLLDEKSGEVVHIDLGVAFEAGRILPIPEVVPFRLTRDIVDGFGITKTEGVFRRSCEFTLEALRKETDNIMTLLNVLRYDPLYSWTLSPLRAKRIQEAQENTEDGVETPGSKKLDDGAGEADRALSVVEKKLSKTLSVAATVNELIQQATDERNLAILFAGWAAWA